jgi:ribose transport system substrate-binding protein
MVVTDGEFDIKKQIADYKHVIEMKPDVIITIPLDTVETAGVLRSALERGIRLVFMDTVPAGLQHPEHYAGLVMADSYANGRVGAEIIADHLEGDGEVALLHWTNRMFTVDQRSLAARETFATYPDITIVAERSFQGVYDVRELTLSIVSEFPGIDGLWVVWDTPALEAAQVIRQQQLEVVVATVDLSYDTAMAIARQEVVIGTGAQHPYDQGYAEAMIAVAALAGKTPPPYVVVPAAKVTRSSLRRSWQRVHHNELPVDIQHELDRST